MAVSAYDPYSESKHVLHKHRSDKDKRRSLCSCLTSNTFPSTMTVVFSVPLTHFPAFLGSNEPDVGHELRQQRLIYLWQKVKGASAALIWAFVSVFV